MLKKIITFQSIKSKSILLIVIAFLVYANTLQNGFVLDDDVVYLKNQYVQAGTEGIKNIFTHGFLHGFNGKNDQSYRPLVLLNFALEHQFFGNNPRAHHFINILFYGLVCLLVFKLLLLLFNEQERWLAFWIALVFLIHPIHTEVVSNIKGRDDLLHGVFFLLTLFYSIKYFDSKQNKDLIISLLSLFLACLSKEIAITVIAVLPVSLYVFRNESIFGSIKKTVWLLIPIAAYFLIRNQILDTMAFEEKMSVINNGIAAGTNIQEQLGITFSILSKYIQLLFFPHPLSWDYSYPYFKIVSVFNSKILIFVVLFIALLVWSIYAIIKQKNRIAFGILFFVITFSIVSNFFILIGATLGERFMFLPSIGFSIIIVFLFKLIIQNLGVNEQQIPKYLSYLVVSVSILFSVKTIDRNTEWKSNATLFESGYYATPNSSRAVSAFASTYREKGEFAQDINTKQVNFNKAITLYNQSLLLYDQVADVWYNIGICYLGLNELELAKNAFSKSLNIEPSQINAANNLGVVYFRQNNLTEAEKYFLHCIKINKNFSSAHANLGAINHNRGNILEARSYYEEALRLNPNDQNTRINLSKL